MPQALPAHCSSIVGEQVSLFPGLEGRNVVVPNNKLLFLLVLAPSEFLSLGVHFLTSVT